MTRTMDKENFPVGSFLVAAPLRPLVHAYYRFARAADDISDDGTLTPEAKVAGLDEMDRQLLGASGDGPARDVREALQGTSVPIEHCRDLLVAFKRDSVKPRTRDWADLMDYCRYSAAPVGRFLLDLHGESRETWGPSDALCAALQVLNHLQDCQDDLITLDRAYLPQDILDAKGAAVDMVKGERSTPELRAVLDAVLDLTRPLVAKARTLPGMVKAGGLRRETSVIVVIAERLTDLLATHDPVAERVELSKPAYAAAALTGIGRTLFPWGM